MDAGSLIVFLVVGVLFALAVRRAVKRGVPCSGCGKGCPRRGGGCCSCPGEKD